MKILLYNPDNGVTRNFMPHLWMFLLQALTPSGHEVPVVMGGPHVTEMADEALGRDGGPRHADAVALGEADATWPRIVEDAARGELKDVYAPVDAFGQESKPSLKEYPVIPWQSID